MLIAILVLGISGAQIAVQGERAARNERDRLIALQSAEAALLDAEMDIEASPDSTRSRSEIFAADRAEGFVEGCGAGTGNPYLGLCQRAVPDFPIWTRVDFLADDEMGRSVPFGHFTGQAFAAGEGVLPARLPRYVIELMPFNMPGGDASTGGMTYFYRITAIGFGTRISSQVLLQTFYRKAGS